MLRLIVTTLTLMAVLPTASHAEERVLEEIIVTAQKREQSQQDVPISVQVISGEDLSRHNINNVLDLQNISASITLADGWNTNVVSTAIRGIGTLLASEYGEVQQSVVVSVDDVPFSRAGGFWLDLMDIERIEVLRGPQGTLFGKNATGGVLNIVTAAPSTEREMSIELVGTTDDEATVRGTLTGPLGPIASRLTFWYSDRDGHIKNFGPAEDAGGRKSWGARTKLQLDLSESVSALLTGRYSKSENSSQFVMAQVFDMPLPGLRQAEVISPVVAGPKNDQINTNTSSSSETDDWSIDLKLDWNITDSLDFTSITSYRRLESELRTDVDQNPLPFVAESTNMYFLVYEDDFFRPVDDKSFSQELRLRGTGARHDWTVGAYYSRFDEQVNNTTLFFVGSPGVPDSAVFLNQGTWNDFTNDSYAVFGEIEWMLGDRLSLLTGARWTREEIDYELTQVRNGAPTSVLANDFTDDGFTGRLSLRWAQSDRTNFYATISQGYKGPGLSFTTTVTTTNDIEVGSESALSYEVGVKSILADNRVRLNANLFHTTVEDMQAFRLLAGTTTTQLLNVGEAESWGAEIDIDWVATPNLLLGISAVYNDSEYTDFIYDCWPGQTLEMGCTIDLSGNGIPDAQDLAGQRLASLPKFKFVLTGRYDFNLPNAPFNAYLSGKFRWQDDTKYLVTLDPRSVQESYGVLDVSLGFEDHNGRWHLSIFGQNITDEFYARRRSYAGAIGGAFHTLSRDYETYYGVKLRLNARR